MTITQELRKEDQGRPAGAGPVPARPAASPSQLFLELAQCLEDQIEAHEELVALLGEERRALAGLEVGAIHACAERKMEIGQRIAVAEARRRRVCESLGQILGLSAPERSGEPRPPVRMTEILARAPESHRPLLTDLRERLVEALETTGSGQRRNRTLCERFLGVMARSMEAVQSAVASLPLYNTTAKVGQPRARGVVVSQTA